MKEISPSFGRNKKKSKKYERMKIITIPSSTRILIWHTLFLKIPTLVTCPGVLIGAVSTFSSPMYTNLGPVKENKFFL